MLNIKNITQSEFDKLLNDGYQIDEMITVSEAHKNNDSAINLKANAYTIRNIGGKSKVVKVGNRIYRIFK